MIFSSGTSSALLNGVPGKTFYYRRGVRQGDPLSPLLFVTGSWNVIECSEWCQCCRLSESANADCIQSRFSNSSISDDTLIIMEGFPRHLLHLKSILHIHAPSAGLKVDHSKSMMVPINMSDERCLSPSKTFGCLVGTLPFTYLGLPLGLTKPRVDEFLPMVISCYFYIC